MQLATCCRPGTACEHGEEAVCRQVGELGAHLEIAPSTISHHLKELRDAGLVKSRRRGQCTECWVDPDILRALSEFFSTPLG